MDEELIIEVVCKYNEITLDELRAKTRRTKISFARFMAMVLLKESGRPYSQQDIADLLGLKDHSSINYGVTEFENLYKQSAKFRDTFNLIKSEVKIRSDKTDVHDVARVINHHIKMKHRLFYLSTTIA